jgi:multidrug efflux pump subunit AcrA (membrane-fusion protein)
VVGVPEAEAGQVRVGTAAEIEFDAMPGKTFTAKVSRVGLQLDRRPRTMRIEIDLPNPDRKVLPGMTGTVKLTLGKGAAEALRLSHSSFHLSSFEPGRGSELVSSVYVYRDGKAVRTRVVIGYHDEVCFEITSGLSATDRVVADADGLYGDEISVTVVPDPPKK